MNTVTCTLLQSPGDGLTVYPVIQSCLVMHTCYFCGGFGNVTLNVCHKLYLPRIAKEFILCAFYSIDEVADTGERVKRFKTGKEKKRKHKVEKMKDEEIESAEDYDRQISVGEFEDQEYSSRGASKRKLGDNKASVETVKKKRPLEESSSYRERNSRTSSKVLAGVSESDRSREGSLWKPSLASESYKQSEASLDRYRDDRHGSARKTKSYLADDEYSRRGRDRERDRPTDGSEYGSRKRKRLSH